MVQSQDPLRRLQRPGQWGSSRVRERRAEVRQAIRGLLDRALPPARHRARVLRGLDLARALRARAARRSSSGRGSTSVGSSSSRSTGSYFTKELDAARTSIIVVRGRDGEVRAFHNICRHRGNKLVWQDYPGEETQRHRAGSSRASTTAGATASTAPARSCSRRASSSTSTRPTTASCRCSCDVWEGFIFVNLDTGDTAPLRDYLGELGAGLEGYPFGEMTQVYKYRAEVGSNWKLFIDAFAEFYHAPVLHAKQYVDEESRKLAGLRLRRRSHYELDGPHGMVSSWGGMAPPKDLEHGQADRAGPAQRPLRRRGTGPTSGSTAARRASTRRATRRGASTRSSSSPTS